MAGFRWIGVQALLWKICRVTVSSFLLIGACTSLSGQCTDTADFNSWNEPGTGSDWQILSNHTVWEVTEILPLAPTFFVSNQQFINVRFSFDMVSRNGLTGNPVYTPVAHSFGESKGWITDKNYHFEVTYTTLSLQIDIDGTRIFYLDRCNDPGKLGFYTFSQHDVEFSNFILQPVAGAFVPVKAICQGDSLWFSLENPDCPGINPFLESWIWDFGDGTSAAEQISGHHTYDQPGIFNLALMAIFSDSCQDTVETGIQVQPVLSVDLGPDSIVPANSSLVLTAGPDNGNFSYLWSNGSALNRLYLDEITDDTLISVLVTHGLFLAYDEIRISVETSPPNYHLVIFNRWGQQVFEATSPFDGWNGKFKDMKCPEEIYVYIIEYRKPGPPDQPVTHRGNLYLLKH
jgi:gliding motility-associated-like protein